MNIKTYCAHQCCQNKMAGLLKSFAAFNFGLPALTLALLLSASAHAQVMSSDVTLDNATKNVGIDQNLNAQVPLDIDFRDESGKQVQLNDYFGDKPVILALVYYECPMLCTMVLNGLLQGIDALEFDVGNEFEIVTVSFDPTETAEMAGKKKNAYLAKYQREGAENGWHFLTGAGASIKKLTDAVGFRYKMIPETGEFVHASGIMLLTPGGKLSRYFYGIEYPARDLRLGLIEASANKIGSAVDQVLLFCYHYDPTTGKYGLVIMNVIRLVGAVTVIVLVGFIIIMLRRDRRMKRHLSSI